MKVKSSDNKVLIEIHLPVSRLRAWNLLTGKNHVQKWWGKHVNMEVKAGGTFQETWVDNGQQIITAGKVNRCSPLSEIVMSWKDEDWPGETNVSFALSTEDEGTKLVLRHSGWEIHPEGKRFKLIDTHVNGWSGHLERLQKYAIKIDSNMKVKVIKEFNVPAEKVFEAWVDPGWISRWMFGPKVRDEEIIKLNTDPQEGGTFSFLVRRDGETINHVGKYLEVERPHRLVFTWGIELESEDESVVRIKIESTENGCSLTLTHELDPAWEAYADQTKEAWSFMLDKLYETIER